MSGAWVGFAVLHSHLLNIVRVRITSQQMVTFMLAVFTITNLYQLCLSPDLMFPSISTYSAVKKNYVSTCDYWAYSVWDVSDKLPKAKSQIRWFDLQSFISVHGVQSLWEKGKGRVEQLLVLWLWSHEVCNIVSAWAQFSNGSVLKAVVSEWLSS